ncbi:lysylphosphatidylglycerol synthase domain-containing protein, partial [Bradyrhizobium sp. NBAIM08]|uniref:lysylphosphatidylglycerol synthase domain-containing protein n=1 Tax=Bradyrhizobium sp. NBAIM08 TaxID=2793815 RepID=UPI001CD1F564
YSGALLVWFGFTAYATLLRPDLLERAVHAVVGLPLLRRFAPRVRAVAAETRVAVDALRGQPIRFYAIAIFWSVIHWTARYAVPLFVALSFTRDLRPVLYLLRTAGLWLAGLAMPTPGGSGGIEALFLIYLAPLLP